MINIKNSSNKFNDFSKKLTSSIGSTTSLVIHTILFIGSFSLYFFGFQLETILLVLTTWVSLEAIYLSIFIQMTVNKQAQDLEEVSEDIEEIQEDVDEIQKDVDEIQEDVEEDRADEKIESDRLKHIEDSLQSLLAEISKLQK